MYEVLSSFQPARIRSRASPSSRQKPSETRISVSLPPFALLPEGHALAGRPSVTPEDLAQYPMVLLDLPMSAEYFLSFFRQRGIAPRIVERTRDVAVMRSLVANGFGYSVANARPLTELSPDGHRLSFVPMVAPFGS